MRLAQLYCCVGGWSSRIGALGIAVPFALPLFIPCFHYNPASRKKQGIIRENPVTVAATGFLMAEKEGFEPSRPFRGLHDFQSCALDQLGDFSIAAGCSAEMIPAFFQQPMQNSSYYTRGFPKVKPFFNFS